MYAHLYHVRIDSWIHVHDKDSEIELRDEEMRRREGGVLDGEDGAPSSMESRI